MAYSTKIVAAIIGFSLIASLTAEAFTPENPQNFEGRHPKSTKTNCAALLTAPEQLAQERTHKIFEKQKIEVREKIIYAHPDQQDIIFVYGIPKSVRRIEHQGKMIFRHYSPNFLKDILSSKTLKAGPRPYIDPEPHARREYQDLGGIMFTTPDFSPEDLWMNYNRRTPWVDFTLDPNVPVLEVAKGNYLIPAQKNYPSWLREKYETYIQSGIPDHHLQHVFIDIQNEGGLLPQFEIPIHVIAFSQ